MKKFLLGLLGIGLMVALLIALAPMLAQKYWENTESQVCAFVQGHEASPIAEIIDIFDDSSADRSFVIYRTRSDEENPMGMVTSMATLQVTGLSLKLLSLEKLPPL